MPEPTREPLTWRRVASDLLRPSRAQVVIGLILCLCSLGIVWQVRARQADDTYSGMRRADLVQILDQLNGNAARLRKDVAAQEEAKRQLQSGANSRKVAEDKASARVKELQVLAGTVGATGPGVVITVSDPQNRVSGDMLLDAVEEMRDAGAEAIDINGVRVVAQTWFAGNSGEVQIDGRPVSSPYVLTVIGESHALEEGARFRGGLVSQAQAPQVGASVSITQSQSLAITSLHQPRQPSFAEPSR